MEKAGLIGLVKLRYIESDEKLSLRGDKLREAIRQDRDNGLIPFFVSRQFLPICINPIVLISSKRSALLLEQQEPVLLTISRRSDQFARRSSCGFMLMQHMRDLHLSAQSSEAG